MNKQAEAIYIRAKRLQWCLTHCNPVDYSLLGSYVHGILQARILKWAAISFFMGSSQPEIEPHFLCLPH